MLDNVKERAEALLHKEASWEERWEYALQDGKLRVLARFVLMVVMYQMWCWIVKVADKTYSEKESHSRNGESIDSSNKTNGEKPGPSSPQKETARNVLASPTSSFTDKYNSVQAYMDVLAKPVGSLGTLEEWAARLCALQERCHEHRRTCAQRHQKRAWR